MTGYVMGRIGVSPVSVGVTPSGEVVRLMGLMGSVEMERVRSEMVQLDVLDRRALEFFRSEWFFIVDEE